MRLKAVLFDLDGTLLPMDQDKFTKGYFGLLAQKLSSYGYDQEELVKAIWKSTNEMVENDGEQTNEFVFWRKFSELLGERALRDKPVIEDFYKNEFEKARAFCGYDADAPKIVRRIRSIGLRIVLASNPVSPPPDGNGGSDTMGRTFPGRI